MSQSREHDALVRRVTIALENRYPEMTLITDIQNAPGDPIPPLIASFRPDVYGQVSWEGTVLLAEAKTDDDLDNQHSWNQIAAFINHLSGKANSSFVLSLTGRRADRGRTTLRLLAQELRPVLTQLEVYDGIDFWYLDSSRVTWHLY